MQAMAVVLSFFSFIFICIFWCIWLLMRLRGNKENYPYRGFSAEEGGGAADGKGLENGVKMIIVFTTSNFSKFIIDGD